MLDPVASRLPWMVAAGNHEIEGGSTGGKPFVAYEKRFRMPAVSPPSQSYGCGRGGGLDGGVTGNMCWEGQGADEAQVAATREARRQNLARDSLGKAQFSGKESELAVALAARRVRETFDVHALAFAVEENDEGRGGGGDAVLDQEGEGMELAASLALAGTAVSCCPSEWSGTYDFGNRYTCQCAIVVWSNMLLPSAYCRNACFFLCTPAVMYQTGSQVGCSREYTGGWVCKAPYFEIVFYSVCTGAESMLAVTLEGSIGICRPFISSWMPVKFIRRSTTIFYRQTAQSAAHPALLLCLHPPV